VKREIASLMSLECRFIRQEQLETEIKLRKEDKGKRAAWRLERTPPKDKRVERAAAEWRQRRIALCIELENEYIYDSNDRRTPP
jgi:hypothetical protein